jgi:type I restriction enzyme S subunit
MNQLLQHFKTLTTHPKNAQELKGLIVRLALRGNLTKNWRLTNPNVSDVSQLIKDIQTEKNDLIERRKLRPNKSKEIKVTLEMKYKIPETWKWFNLSEVAFFQEGPGIRKWQFRETGVKLLNVQNIVGDALVLDNTDKHVDTDEFLEKYQHFQVEEGDLLFASSGGSWGKSAWFKDPGYKVMLNTSMVRLCFYSKDWFQDYLKTFISSEFFKDQMRHQLVGIQPNFGSTHLNRVYIPIPPLEEQKAIVEVVNQLFVEIEELEQQTKARIQLKQDYVTSALQQLANGDTAKEWTSIQAKFSTFFTEKSAIKQLRESILQLAVQGKLTTHWRTVNPDTEDASVLLERIKAEKEALIKTKTIKKEKLLPAITEDEIPYDLPEGWVWCKLGTVTDIIAGASFKSGDFNSKGGTKCIKITNAGVREFVESKDYLPGDFDEKYPNYLIKEGDLVLALTRPYIKAGLKISTCPPSYNNSLLNQRVAAIRSMTDSIYHPYIFSFIQSPEVLSYYKEKFDGKSQQPNMKMGDITDLVIALPPTAEQKAIVEKVNTLMALCDKLEKEIKVNTTQVEQLMQSCLKEVLEDKPKSRYEQDLENIRMSLAAEGEKEYK